MRRGAADGAEGSASAFCGGDFKCGIQLHGANPRNSPDRNVCQDRQSGGNGWNISKDQQPNG
ncbi:hypothetical protein PLACP1_21670 [Planifilum fimeticola]